jgi:mannosyl-oligosaccharide alpha-1,2-mannosidase
MGANADSFYEYLLKAWLLNNKHSSFLSYKRMWDLSMNTTVHELIKCSDHSHMHLACFLGGNLILGDRSYLKIAAAITESCVHRELGADGFTWRGSRPISECIAFPQDDGSITGKANLQRPETVESLFYLYRATQNTVYRDIAWLIFTQLNQTSVFDVDRIPVALDDRQQSFFIAEELKYFLLLFQDTHRIDLDMWIFNTEAHPLPVFEPMFESVATHLSY